MMHNGEPIRIFRGPWGFLSNFYIEPDGTHVEREYQAQKCARETDRDEIMRMSPGNAKRAGRRVAIRADWENVKVETMRALVRQKFVDHPGLADLLLQTENRELIEGNWWGDRFWGKVDNGYGTGENWLGKILMETRNMLRRMQDSPAQALTIDMEEG